MPAFIHFDSWAEYVQNLLYAPSAPLAPTTSAYRILLTNGLTMTRSMNKAEIISAELLPDSGYVRRAYNPGSGANAGTWDQSQLRYENQPVIGTFAVTATVQYSGVVVWSNSPADNPTRACPAANVNAATDRLTIPNHGMSSGAEVVVTSTGTRPGGIAANTLYWVQNIDSTLR